MPNALREGDRMKEKTMHHTATPPRNLWKRKQGASYLSVSQRKFDQLVASGEIPKVQIDSCVRFDPADLRAFAESCKTT